MEDLYNFIRKSFLTTGLYIARILLHGLVLMMLWKWFVIPVFTIRPITSIEATGLAMIILYFAPEDTYRADASVKSEWYHFYGSLAHSALYLMLGFILLYLF